MNSKRSFATLTIVMLVIVAALGPVVFRQPEPASASYLQRLGYYVNYDSRSFESLQANIDHLDIVSPYFYHLTPSGQIKAFDQPETTRFVQDRNVKVVPIIQNESRWDEFTVTIGTPEKQQAIVDRIVEMVEDKGYDGIQIDFEAINATDADLLTAFMKLISAEMRSRSLIISQAVIARLSDTPSVWGGAYDYEELAKYNDFIVVMAYDFTPAGASEPGPVAPLPWVRQVLSYTTSQVDPSKVFLGVPFYGYDWDLEESPPATSFGYDGAIDRLAMPGATGGFSAESGSPWIRYIDEEGHEHEAWYENSESLELKLQAALDYEVAGFGAWRLGTDDPDNWRVISNLETPASPVSGGASTATSWYFPETSHWLEGEFLDYWLANGGLSRFGYPRTERFVEFDPLVNDSYEVQYFERGRLEYHPEFAGTEFEVLLGHIGRWSLAQRGIDPWKTVVDSTVSNAAGRTFYPESGHSLGGMFRDYWQANGGLFGLGYPLTEEFVEINPEDGQSYTVQYFERARLEAHIHSGTGEQIVLLGLLGNEMLRDRRWIR